jgi:threonine dehydratase
MKIKFEEFIKASKDLKEIITPSPLIKNEWLSNKFGCNIFLKLDNMLPVGSFKMRGAAFKMMNLTNEEKKRGVLAVSAGNHAQGVAWAAQKQNIKAKIIMPVGSALTKINNTKTLGAEVILHGENVEESFKFGEEYQKKHKMTFIHPFYDSHVIAGQGSIAFEILEQLPKVDFVFGSIGGGGLMSGVGRVFKEKKSHAIIVGSQAEGASTMVRSLMKGSIVKAEPSHTFADGIKVKNVIPEMYALLDHVIDEAVAVNDDAIAMSVLELMEQARIIAEGAGAINLAAFEKLYSENPKRFKKKNIVLIICGGNIDINLIDRIIEKGLIASKRRARIAVTLSDKPGTLNQLTKILFEKNANILQTIHDREAIHLPINESQVHLTLEIKGEEHLLEILTALKKEFSQVELLK